MPKITVIVPVFGLEKYVGDCIDGLLNQKVNFEFEVIAVDDASSDASLKILQERALTDSKLKVFSNPKNLGLAATMRHLLSYAAGEYIVYMDGDDLAYPGKLSVVAEYMDSHPGCAIAYHEARVFDSDSDETLQYYSRDHYNRDYVPATATVEDLIRYGCFLNASSIVYRQHDRLSDAVDPKCRILLDYPFHILNALHLGGTIDRIDDVLGGYRIHRDSFGGQTLRSNDRRIQVLRDQEQACENARCFGMDAAVIAEGMAHHRFATALFFLKSGHDDLFQRFIDDASRDNWFFDERHQLAFADRARPNSVRQRLFPDLLE